MITYIDPPDKCDVCQNLIKDEFVDGRTTNGPWANMCIPCHRKIGRGFGTGNGQRYKLDPTTKRTFVKVEG